MQPTAPFREGFVRAEIARILDEFSIPYFTDRCGNLLGGASSFTDLGKGFRIGLMAHMDHPGFHLDAPTLSKDGLDQKQCQTQWQCRWYGGAPWTSMQGKAVRVFDPADKARSIKGIIHELVPPDQDYEDGLKFTVNFAEDPSAFSETGFGAFDFPAYELRGDQVITRAADDLAGCAIALGALLDQELRRPKRAGPRQLVGIFTRAEEVGFIGCVDLIKSGKLKKNLWCLSLEASKQLPEALAGHGPVLRIGDASCLFDAEFSALLWQTARRLEKESRETPVPFLFQRRLMSGGTCEATPLMLHGFKTTGLAVPLLNYHNIGADSPEAEIISLADVEGARRLCGEFASASFNKSQWASENRKEIDLYHKSFKAFLAKQIDYDEEAQR